MHPFIMGCEEGFLFKASIVFIQNRSRVSDVFCSQTAILTKKP